MSSDFFERMNNESAIATSIEQLFKNVVITDNVYLSEEQSHDLESLWELRTGKYHNPICPADILYQNTIPVSVMSFSTSGFICDVVILPDMVRELLQSDVKKIVGALRINYTEPNYGRHDFYYELEVLEEHSDFLVAVPYGSKDDPFSFNNEEMKDNICKLGVMAMNLWYSIQICLLNPVTKIIFSNPICTKIHGKEKIKAQKYDRTIKYIKHYYVKDDDITNALFGGNRSIHRKCLVWYVTGHWREYKSGKKVFIQGYWKGALRNTPPKDTEPRKRELVINEIEEN